MMTPRRNRILAGALTAIALTTGACAGPDLAGPGEGLRSPRGGAARIASVPTMAASAPQALVVDATGSYVSTVESGFTYTVTWSNIPGDYVTIQMLLYTPPPTTLPATLTVTRAAKNTGSFEWHVAEYDEGSGPAEVLVSGMSGRAATVSATSQSFDYIRHIL